MLFEFMKKCHAKHIPVTWLTLNPLCGTAMEKSNRILHGGACKIIATLNLLAEQKNNCYFEFLTEKETILQNTISIGSCPITFVVLLWQLHEGLELLLFLYDIRPVKVVQVNNNQQ